MQRFRVDLKTFLGLAMPNQCSHMSESKCLANFLVGFWGKKPQTLLRIPIYSTTILYENILVIQNKAWWEQF